MPFVGRERELAVLAEEAKRTAEGQHARVVLTGAAGLGCSRLLDELERWVRGVPGIVICRGRAHEPAGGLPYQALGDALASALAHVDDERLGAIMGRAGHDLSAVVADLDTRLDRLEIDHDPPSLQAPGHIGRRVVESISGTLSRLAEGGVVLLVLEDIHWADPATRAFIGSLLGTSRPLPICLVVTYQPDELHRRHPARALVDRLRDDPSITRLALGPLSDDEIAQVIGSDEGGAPPASLRTAVIEGARGNPLMASLLAAAAATLEEMRLSDDFEQLCGARLEGLPNDAASIVRIVAAARKPLERERLARLVAHHGRLSSSSIEAAVGSGLVIRSNGAFRPSHDLYAEAIEALELPPERQALHGALARELDDVPALAAWHWSLAARPIEARAAHLRAAAAAARLDPGETTWLHYQRALELPAGDDAPPEALAELLLGWARATAAAGSYRRAAALTRRVLAIRSARPQRAYDEATRLEIGELLDELSRYQWAAGDPGAAIDSLERALRTVPDRPSRVRAGILASLAGHLMEDSRFRESAASAERARADAAAAADAGDDTLTEASHATGILGVDVAYMGEFERGLGLLEDAAAMARRDGRLDDLMRVAANRMWILDLDARREQALAVVKEGLRDAEAGGLVATYGALLRLNSVDILYHLGRWAEAEAQCRAAIEAPPPGMEWAPWQSLSLVLADARADEEAVKALGQTMLALEAAPAGQWTALKLRAAVSLSIWRGAPADALAMAEREWPRVLETDDPAQVAWAASISLEAAAAAGEHARLEHDAGLLARARTFAAAALPQAEARVAGGALDPSLGASQEAELHLATARAHRRRLLSSARPERWAAIAEAWSARSAPFLEAKARWWQALAILETASGADANREAAREAASGPLSEAYARARDLPALPLLRTVVDLAARARVPLSFGDGSVASVPIARDLVAVGPGHPEPIAARRAGAPIGELAGRADVARAIEDDVLAALRHRSAHTYGLSPREREVLAVLAEGRSDRDIAGRLFISENTVHVHVRRILAKLGVASRTEAAGVAIRQGLVPRGAQAER